MARYQCRYKVGHIAPLSIATVGLATSKIVRKEAFSDQRNASQVAPLRAKEFSERQSQAGF
jgi:hypothetical protein